MNSLSTKQIRISVALALVSGALVAGSAVAQSASPAAPSAAPPSVNAGTAPPPTPMAAPPAPGMPSSATPGTPTPSMNGNNSQSGAITSIAPSKSELSSSAFEKLDVNKRGYVTRADVSQLSGFDAAFRQADANNDGRLSQDEFQRAWALYGQQ